MLVGSNPPVRIVVEHGKLGAPQKRHRELARDDEVDGRTQRLGPAISGAERSTAPHGGANALAQLASAHEPVRGGLIGDGARSLRFCRAPRVPRIAHAMSLAHHAAVGASRLLRHSTAAEPLERRRDVRPRPRLVTITEERRAVDGRPRRRSRAEPPRVLRRTPPPRPSVLATNLRLRSARTPPAPHRGSRDRHRSPAGRLRDSGTCAFVARTCAAMRATDLRSDARAAPSSPPPSARFALRCPCACVS